MERVLCPLFCYWHGCCYWVGMKKGIIEMRKQINFELVQFHVHEAACELFTLVARLKEMQGKQMSEAEKIMAMPYRKLDFTESAIKVSLEHAYHHLNFAWNARKKEWKDADRHFERDEEFPTSFVRFWQKAMLKHAKKVKE